MTKDYVTRRARALALETRDILDRRRGLGASGKMAPSHPNKMLEHPVDETMDLGAEDQRPAVPFETLAAFELAKKANLPRSAFGVEEGWPDSGFTIRQVRSRIAQLAKRKPKS